MRFVRFLWMLGKSHAIARKRNLVVYGSQVGPKEKIFLFFIIRFPVTPARGNVTFLQLDSGARLLNHRKPIFRKTTRESHNQTFDINMGGGFPSKK
ncbi:hypothetical protein F5Y11DRAFT_229594 [Daldinia sp. FL1419]|nr:hypothetical protein F5Y11DRAFT_229594 [Daldinia sp. FL1419]